MTSRSLIILILKLICILFLGIIGIIMLGSLIWMIAQLKNPPPDIEDLKFIIPIIIPFYMLLGGGVVTGLTWFAVKKEEPKK